MLQVLFRFFYLILFVVKWYFLFVFLDHYFVMPEIVHQKCAMGSSFLQKTDSNVLKVDQKYVLLEKKQ